jgi:hypothetical protein
MEACKKKKKGKILPATGYEGPEEK